MREFEVKPHLQNILRKLHKKDKVAYEAIMKKIEEIVESPTIDHYKNLRYDLKEMKRVHVATHFVLIFSYDKSKDFITFLDFEHHDMVYRR